MSRAPLSLIPKCGLCGLHKKCHSPKMPVHGRGQRKVLVVGEGPGETEDRRGRPFVPEAPAGSELYDALRGLGVDPDRDCWLTNALICKSPPDPEPQLIDHCRANVANAVRTLKPEKVILLGGPAVRSVLGWLWKEDPGGVSRWAGFRCPAVEDGDGNTLNAWVCPTFHPSFVLRSKEPDLARLFFRRHLGEALALEGRPFQEVPDYAAGIECLRNDAQAARRLEEFARRDGAVAFDFETDRLKPEGGGRILSASVSDDVGTTAFMWGPRSARAFRELMLSGRPKVCHNCFSGDTRFLTREYGVVPLAEMGGRQVTVLNHEGRWVGATVACFGVQETTELFFARRNFMVSVRATPGHEWLVCGRRERLKSSELRSARYKNRSCLADAVPFISSPKVVDDLEDYYAGVRHGFVWGDGSRTKTAGSFQVRLCGEKKEMLPFFQGRADCTITYPRTYGGDPMVYLRRQRTDLKKPPQSATASYLIGLVRGLLASDGTVSKHSGQVSLTNSKSTVQWVMDHAPRVGFQLQSCTDMSKYDYGSRFGKGPPDCLTLYFARESVSVEDLLRQRHRVNHKGVDLGPFKFSKRGGTRLEPVYCAIVPDGNSFTLDHGLVTGNCKYEIRWCRRVLGVTPRNLAWDSMVQAHLIDNRSNACALKFLAFALLGAPSYDLDMKRLMEATRPDGSNRLDEAPPDKLLLYGGLDARFTLLVARRQAEYYGETL